MRILLLCHSLGVGGTERQLVTLAKGLQERGRTVAVAVLYANGALEHEVRERGIPVMDLRKAGRGDTLGFFIRAVRTVRAFKPTVVYGFLNTPNILAAMLKPFVPGTRVVWGVRSSHVDLARYDWLSRLATWAERLACSFADLIICNSRAGLEHAAARGFPRARMISIPNGIDVERFAPDAAGRIRVRNEWRIADGEILIGHVGRLDPMKDHHSFLRAAALLSRDRADVRFACVGDGPDAFKAQLQRLAEELGLLKILIWPGVRTDMAAVFNAMDMAVSSSYGEGFSNIIAEAMACGVPCVVTDVGDSALIVESQGVVVAPRVPEALYQGMRRMLDQLAAQSREAVRAAILDRYTPGILVDETLAALSRMH
jgi:glycosyltransferase involved in cell wall biosynthesis